MQVLKSFILRSALYRKCASFIKVERFCSWSVNVKLPKPTYQVLNLCLASGFVVTFKEDEETIDQKEVKDKITVAEPKEFSNTFQLQQATNNAVNSSMVVLSNSFHTFHLAHQEYVTLLQAAITALLRGLEVSPTMCEQLGIEEYLSLVQSEIFLQKSIISDSFFVFEESTKLLCLAANISFLVGNEISSGLASAHLHNVQQEVWLLNLGYN